MKKSKANNFVILVSLLTIITLILVAGTYAKYTEGVNTSGTAIVAKWSVAIKNGNQQMTDSTKVKLTDTTLNGKVKADHIAPGTDGAFGFTIDASGSEVAVDYVIEISNLIGAPKNFVIKYNGAELLPEGGVYKIAETIALDDVETAVTPTLTWEWPYQTGDITNGIAAGDADDNTAGTSADHTAEDGSDGEISFDVKITAVQADPRNA